MEQLNVPFALDLGDASASGSSVLSCTTLVRQVSGKRLVCTGEWRGAQVFVKVFLPRLGARRRWRREEQTVRALLANDILTPPLLYSGYLPGRGVYVLVFQAIAGAVSALQLWHGGIEDAERMALLRRLVRAVAIHHDAGLVQRDLHLGNFLLQGSHMYTIDASLMRRVGQCVGKGRSLDNLGLLFAQLYPAFDRFVEALYADYVRARGWPESASDLATLWPSIDRHRMRRTKDYLRKLCKDHPAFVCQKDSRQFTLYDRSYCSQAFDGLLRNTDSLLEGGRYLKRGNTSTVALVSIDGRRLVIKRYNIKSVWHGLNRALRRTRASVAWRNAHILRLHGVDTARPVALIEQRIGVIRRRSYFVSEYVEGINAQGFFLSDTVSADTKARVARRISALIDTLAKLKVEHGDLKATNFIIADDRPFLTDLDAMRQYKLGVGFGRAQARDRNRFMKNWDRYPAVRELFTSAEQPH